jgi:hypothetical protein
MLRFVALLLITTCSLAHGAEKMVLVERLPKGAEPTMILRVVKQAFIGRHWTIEGEDATSVTGVIERPPLTARMRISIYGQALVYEGSAPRRTASGPQNGVLMYDRPLSAKWVQNLKNDIGLAFATVPDR